MSLLVATSEDFEITFNSATTWHIDDIGMLHLKSGPRQVASFASGRWVYVADAPDSE